MSKKKNWTDSKKIKLHNMYMKYGPEWSKFSKILGIHKEAVRSVFNRTDWNKFFEKRGIEPVKIIEKAKSELVENESIEEEYNIEEHAKELIKLRKDRLCELGEKRKMNEHLDRIAKDDLVYEKITSAISQVKPITVKQVNIKPQSKKETSPQEAFMIFSDSHVGLAVIPEEVGGLGEYNVDIFKRRALSYKNKVIHITNLHRATHDIDVLHLCLIGDMVHGGNDAGQWGFLHTEQTVMDQIFDAFTVLTEIIGELSQVFKEVKVHCVYGNHGRIAKRNVEKKYVNWDYLIYKWLEGSMGLYKNVNFEIPRGPFQIAESLGNKILLIHGDQAKSWAGIPWYGLQRLESKYRSVLDGNKSVEKMWKEIELRGIDPCSREAGEFACQYMKSFDMMILGHFHMMGEVETNSGGRIIMNSSFIGGDDFSINDLVSCSVPAQRFFGVNHNGKTWSYDIELDR